MPSIWLTILSAVAVIVPLMGIAFAWGAAYALPDVPRLRRNAMRQTVVLAAFAALNLFVVVRQLSTPL